MKKGSEREKNTLKRYLPRWKQRKRDKEERKTRGERGNSHSKEKKKRNELEMEAGKRE